MVMRNWTQIGNPKPVYKDDKADRSFEIRLPYSVTLSLDGFVSHNVINKEAGWDINVPIIDRRKESSVPSSDQVRTEEVPSKDVSVPSKDDLKVLIFCAEYRSLKEISDLLGLKNLQRIRKMYIDPLLEKGYLERKYPESPRSPHQKYITTLIGLTRIKDI